VKVVRIATEPEYDVRIGRGLMAEVAEHAAPFTRCALLSDEKVASLYQGKLGLGVDVPAFVVTPGEDSKSLSTLELVLEFMARSELDRRSCLIALGGGVVGDLGGLAASLYMRGIAFIQVPTTLLAQVDSSVGGKTAVNLRRGKNLAGTFHQPSLVIADTEALATLTDDEFRSGLGEVIKTALIEGEQALSGLESSAAAIMKRDRDALAEIVARSVRTKAEIVRRDPLEHGERKLLNLGHTFAHAIEHAAGYGRIPHGVAVGVGILLSLSVSRDMGLLLDDSLPQRARDLLLRFGMATSLDALRRASHMPLLPAEILAGARHDKKGSAGRARLVLLEAPGKLRFDVDASPEVLERCVSDA